MAGIQTISFLVITVCLLLSSVNAEEKCGPNEVFQQYYNAGCEPSCQVPNKSGIPCSSRPVPGCACQPGFYRNSKKDCVTLKQCESSP
ncbi:hypothetical protein ILUMI_26160 [Ignelater luminosus]|uniref:TIL domain-containing protein n=1 Tax=Ignelater luminosus TaxID=2038154 RepID=A0A8K0CA95_IGNLU|nr:hypothetical protein ILUMI_26160 [Ignelater luminosus]